MSQLEVHPEIRATAKQERKDYSTCFECRRSFRAKNEDQYSVQLCDTCFEIARHLDEPVISVHVRLRPRKAPIMV